MFNFFKKFLSKEQQSPAVNIIHLICEPDENQPLNTWFMATNWKNKYFLKWNGAYSKSWKIFESDVPVSGISMENRPNKLLSIINEKDFQIKLQKDPTNHIDSSAIKVLAKGGGKQFHIGYLPRGMGAQLQEEPGISAVPQGLFVPHDEYDIGIRIKILIRSAKWKKAN